MREVVETYKFKSFIDAMNRETPAFNHSKKYPPKDNFCTETWQDALKLARYGIKNQKSIENIVKSMSLLEHVKTKGFGMAENGLCVDVGAYLTGEPECWIAEEFNYKPKKCVKLLISIGCAWYYRETQIENRGAGIISLIQMLKKQGYIVKVNLYESCIDHSFDTKYTCFLKIPTNPLDIQSLSYALCSPSLLRRFLFAWLEQKQRRSFCDGYGISSTIDEVAISKDIIHFKGLGYEDCKYEDELETKKYIMCLFDKFLELNNEKRIDNELE